MSAVLRPGLVGFCAFLVLQGAPAKGQEWPDLSIPAQAVGGGGEDAAVVVGIEDYAFVGPVPGAEANAKLWHRYLAETRGVPPQNVKLLTGVDATRNEMLDAVRLAASRAGSKGTLWFVFVGHGAPGSDGKDGLLVAVDAQQKAKSLETYSVHRSELLKALTASRAGAIRVILDACFSGKRPDGSALAPGLQPLLTVAAAGAADPRVVVLTAAKGDQFAGPLPGASRPAFSYLVLGGLRGWAVEGRKAVVTAGDLLRYAANALDATLRGRNQTPDLLGSDGAAIAPSSGEKGPNLSRLAEATSGGSAKEEMFRVSSLAAVPKVQAPRALDSVSAGGLDFRSMDVDALEKYAAVKKADKSDAAPEEKAQAWRRLAKEAPKFADLSERRAAEWERFAEEQKAAEDARHKRVEARDADWEKLSRLLALDADVVPSADKARWSGQFAGAYLQSPGLDPEMARELAPQVAPGPARTALAKLAKTAPATAPAPPPSRAKIVVDELVQGADGARGHLKRAAALAASGDFRAALVEYDRAEKLGSSVDATLGAAKVHMELKDFEKAAESLRYLQMVGAGDQRLVSILLAKADFLRGHYDEAYVTLLKLTITDPVNVMAWINRGQACRRRGKKKEALDSLRKALEVDTGERRGMIQTMISEVQNGVPAGDVGWQDSPADTTAE